MSLTILEILDNLSLVGRIAPTTREGIDGIRAKVKYYLANVDQAISNAVLIPVAAESTLKGMLDVIDSLTAKWRALEEAHVKFLEEGHDGYLICEGEVCAVDVGLATEEDRVWAGKNEMTIIQQVADAFAVDLTVDFHGQICLYKEKGFSGNIKNVSILRKEDTGAASLKGLFRSRPVKGAHRR